MKRKVLLLVLAGTEIEEGRGRVLNALMMANELRDAGHHVKLLFDGAGTEWIPELERKDHEVNHLYESVKECIDGICAFCADAYDVLDMLPDDARLISEYGGHQSYKKYIEDNYEILSF